MVTKNEQAPARYYVNEYLVDQAYGGPEEGGWWYPTGRLVKCHARTQTLLAAQTAQGTLKGYIEEKNEGRRPTSSVLSEGLYRIYLDDQPGGDFPDHRPGYE